MKATCGVCGTAGTVERTTNEEGRAVIIIESNCKCKVDREGNPIRQMHDEKSPTRTDVVKNF